MGGIFGGGSDTQTVKQEVKLPKWIDEGGQELYALGKQVANRPYPTYDYARIAPLSGDEQASFGLTRGNVGNWQPAYGNAFASALGATQPVGAQDISNYMNPYTQQVVDTTLGELYRQQNRQTSQRHGNWAKSGSYLNEDRRAAMDALSDEMTNRVAAQTTAGLYNQAFSDALNQANAERNRLMSASGQFGQLGEVAQTLSARDVANLQQIGGMQRQEDQASLDLAYADHLRQFGYPQEQINYLLGVLRGTPYGQTTASEQLVGQPNAFGSALGGAGVGGAIGGPWGAAIGGGLGFLSAL